MSWQIAPSGPLLEVAGGRTAEKKLIPKSVVVMGLGRFLWEC